MNASFVHGVIASEVPFLFASNPNWALAMCAAVCVVVGGLMLFLARRFTLAHPGRAGANLLAGGLLVLFGVALFAYSMDLGDNLGA